VKLAVEHMGSVNVAVNCAGIIGAGRVLGREAPMALDFFTNTIHVNLVGSFNIIKAVGVAMESNTPNDDGERGVIISTASVAAYDGQIGQAAYSASKGGIVGMTLPIAREFARIGVRVNAVAPGIFWTPMVDGMPEHIQESLSASIPFPSRLGKPEEYAELVAHIVENGYLNGETIRLDGAVRLAPK
ncbi:MAG: SDR family oxidoreductase, partial [Gammaproteobacteria bacterium]|nr:SDR family oxidoreductase [Gammaproteobacteria bacterium]